MQGVIGETDGEAIGVDTVHGDVKVRSYRHSSGITLAYDDTGRLAVEAGGGITWEPPATVDDTVVEGMRADVLGRAMAVLFHLQGVPCLHASAVSIGNEGIAFMGPKGFGKSTTAAALAKAGAGVLTDDTLPVVPGDPVRLRPGVTRIRLLRDSAAHVNLDPGQEDGVYRKVIADRFQEATGMVRFAAAYLLSPAPAGEGVPDVSRELLPAPLATMALIEQGKLGSLLRGREAAEHFRQMAEVAAKVPVYRLRITRDLHRLDAAAHQLLSWHGSASGGEA